MRNNKKMFTGIIETIGRVSSLEQEGSNLHIRVRSSVSDELKIDQSVSHNGVNALYIFS